MEGPEPDQSVIGFPPVSFQSLIQASSMLHPYETNNFQ